MAKSVNALVFPKGNFRSKSLLLIYIADVVELVYTQSSEGCAERLVGSSPTVRTKLVVTLPKGSARVVGSIAAQCRGPAPSGNGFPSDDGIRGDVAQLGEQ